MTAEILEGKSLALNIQNEVRFEIERHLKKGHSPPGLAVILVGEDPASTLYVQNKHRACESVGIRSYSYNLPKTTTEAALIDLIDTLNHNPDIDGILVQLPLPPHIRSEVIFEHILPFKDIDGFHPYNMGRLAQQNPLFRPCTPAGIMLLLETIGREIKSLHATVVGTSTIVGRPMIFELLSKGATVTVCHILTRDLPFHIKQADLLIVATGDPLFIKGEWIKPGAIVIDVGMNRLKTGEWVGDVEFEQAKERASFITPVPGGVGPMTVAVLLKNTLQAYQTRKK